MFTQKQLKTPVHETVYLNGHELFDSLTPEQCDLLESVATRWYFQKRSMVFQEGGLLKGAYLINKGIIKLFKTGISGKDQIISFAGEGDLIAFDAVIENEFSSTSAEAINNVELIFIPGRYLRKVAKENSNFNMEILRMACTQLKKSNDYIVDLAQKSIRNRTAEALLKLKERFELSPENKLQVILTRRELANTIGTCPEGIIRCLKELKNERLIDFDGKELKLLDLSGLKRVACLS